MQQYYESADARKFDICLSFFAANAELTTWAEGVNGRHWHERRVSGLNEIRNMLGSRGFRRVSGDQSGLKFNETESRVESNRIVFMLRPDRLSSDGRPYNPYRIEVTLENCKIKTMAVVEYISWE